MKKSPLIVLVLFLTVMLSLPLGSCMSTSAPVPGSTPTTTPAPQASPTATPAATPTPTPTSPNTGTPTQANPPTHPPLTEDMSQVVAAIRPSVVAIDVQATTIGLFNQPQTIEGAGSGWIIDSDGYVVTNNHVVEGADNVTVTLSDGRVFPAENVSTDPITDLAVVKISASDLTAAPTGNSTALNIADWVAAIGNSLGMGISATVGVVSALDVSLQESPGQTLKGLIQTDAAINPGNSGGPLINTSGEVIGINSIKIAEVGVEGMGYAISINEALPVIQKLIETGYVVRPYLGIDALTVNQAVALRYNLAMDAGVLITGVVSGGPADEAGLQSGDVITGMDGKQIDNVNDLLNSIDGFSVGQTVSVTYWRGQSENTTQVTFAQSPTP